MMPSASALQDLSRAARERRHEASCGAVSFLDREGTRLGGVCLARMPESGMTGLKARLLSEVARIRDLRPDLVLAAADGAGSRGGGQMKRPDAPLAGQKGRDLAIKLWRCFDERLFRDALPLLSEDF